jgi:hypothetical protein
MIDLLNQLADYALAFAVGVQRPSRLFKRAWFDESDYFQFSPLQAVRRMAALPEESGALSA